MESRFRRVRTRSVDERGFTLVEMLISMMLLAIIITSLTAILVSMSHDEVDANVTFQAQLNDRTGLDKLRTEIHAGDCVTDTSGNALNPGQSYSAVTVTLGATVSATCPTTGVTFATWCTSPSTVTTGDFALYRVTSAALPRPTCSTAGTVKWIDYLQPTAGTSPANSTPFCLPSSTVPCVVAGVTVLAPPMSLPLLHVSLPVNVNGPNSTKDAYNLVDDIALRNGTRS